MPAINVSPNEGKRLYLVAKMAGARRVLEIGTLGGDSTTWLSRLLRFSRSSRWNGIKHAEVAWEKSRSAGVADRVEVRVGRAVDVLRWMIAQGEAPFDLIFIDADKASYVEYLDLSLHLSHTGTIILADNVIRNGRVMDERPPDDNSRGAQAYNNALAANQRLESTTWLIIGKIWMGCPS